MPELSQKGVNSGLMRRRVFARALGIHAIGLTTPVDYRA
jgi:hypothetical protein